MPYSLKDKLVIAIASSALFDLSESDKVFREKGVEGYRLYQREHENERLERGVAFSLVRRLLSLNRDLRVDQRLVEVILLSRNDFDTGLRVFKSIEQYELDISRAAFVSGRDPFRYIAAFNAALFLSSDPDDVRQAIALKAPAGLVFPTDFIDNEAEPELRIAFDFDGVIADDSAEAVYKRDGMRKYFASEREHAAEPLPGGPLYRFFREIANLQQRELESQKTDPNYEPRVRTAIVTARNAPAHERLVTSLRKWNIRVDEAFFLGGIDKKEILEVFKPHIFFDDQLIHIKGTAGIAPSVHVPFGVGASSAIELDSDEYNEDGDPVN